MPSAIHAVLVELFEAYPDVLAYLLELGGAALPGPLVPVAGTKTKVVALERRIDRVFVLGSRDAPSGFVLAEVQLDADDNKRFAWSLYVELARSRYRCEGVLVVLTVAAGVRRWIERDILPATGLFGGARQLLPVVIALDELDTSLLLRPERPVLARLAVAAARNPHLTAVAQRAVRLTIEHLSGRLATDQLDAILGMVDETLRAQLEKSMIEHPRFKSETFRRWYAEATEKGMAKGMAKGRAEGVAQGRAKGMVEGVAKGRAEALLTVLAAREIPVSDALRERILSCTDLATLERWLQRATVASSAAAVVRAAGKPRSRGARSSASRTRKQP